MTDLRPREPNDKKVYSRFDGPSFDGILHTVTPRIAKEIANVRDAVAALNPLRYATWPLEIILKT
jgi:hypothetical protein